MPVLNAEFTPEEIEQRPFAAELGYNQWGNQAGHIISYIGVQEVPLGSVLRQPGINDLGAAYAMAADVCREVCETGFQTRDEPVVIMPTPAELATSAIDNRYTRHARYLAELHGVEQRFEGNVVTVPALQTEAIVPRVAEAAYLWGRHGSILGVHEELPTVIRESGLITIRPDSLAERTHTVIEGLQEAIEKVQFSRRERFAAKLFGGYRSRLERKTQESTSSLEQSISQAVQTALIDLASEQPGQ